MAKPTKPKILLVKRTEKFVQIRHESMNTRETVADATKAKNLKAGEKPPVKEVSSSEEIDLTAHEAPLESFDKALQALGVVAAKQLDCDNDWSGKIEVVSLSVSYNERGVRTVTINFVKPMLQGKTLHPLKTPAFQIDDDKESGERRQCTENHADRVIAALKEAQRYVAGERGQGVLGFEEEDETSNVEQLPGMAQPDPAND